MDNRINANYKNLERIINWIQNADYKASIILLFNGGIIAILADKLSNLLKFILSANLILMHIYLILIFVFFILFLLSIYNAFKVLLPDVKSRSKYKLFFFMSICDLSKEEFTEKMKLLSDDEIIENLSEQSYITSEIAKTKFYHLGKSWKFLAISFIFLIILLIINSFHFYGIN